MIRRTGRLLKAGYLVRSVFGDVAAYMRYVWVHNRRRRWLLPLVVLVCSLALVTVASVAVEAVAPFVYGIF